jgi:hypothetical protein
LSARLAKTKRLISYTLRKAAFVAGHALFGGMQFALIGLLTAIVALKRPYLTLDLWVQRSAHEIGLSPAMWADDRLNVGLLNRGRFFPRFNQFGHASIANRIVIGFPPDPMRTDCRLPGVAGATVHFLGPRSSVFVTGRRIIHRD